MIIKLLLSLKYLNCTLSVTTGFHTDDTIVNKEKKNDLSLSLQPSRKVHQMKRL